MKRHQLYLLVMGTILAGCGQPQQQQPQQQQQQTAGTPAKSTFGYDQSFILKHDPQAVILGRGEAKVLVSAKYQAKVFTSTAAGDSGQSFGWIHYQAFDEPTNTHMNAYGGENRFWLGPEGGPFSLFFEKDQAQKFDNWHTPPAYDSEAWDLVMHSQHIAVFKKDMRLRNYAGHTFDLRVDRKITLLHDSALIPLLNINLPKGAKMVAYRTENTVTNTGHYEWNVQTGMPCTWILDMFPPSEQTTILIPVKKGGGPAATTNYFGEIPADRLNQTDTALFFKADGQQRGKLGVHPGRVLPVAGSYDAQHHTLTIILFDTHPAGKYLNQEWRTDRPVFSGDAMNAYNDGPLANGKQMGPFYELESVGTALFLPPNHKATHWHSVFHFSGDHHTLNSISQKVLHLNLDEIPQ